MGGEYNSGEDIYVCSDCFEDIDLKVFITNNAHEYECNFCGNQSDSVIAVSVYDIAQHIKECFSPDYASDAMEQIHYDSREGFDAPAWDTYNLLVDELSLELPNDGDSKLLRAIIDAIGDTYWCEKYGYYGTDYFIYKSSWDNFCNLIKHRKRYFFIDDDSVDYFNMKPEEMLNSLQEFCNDVDLYSKIPAGLEFYRVRKQNGSVDLSSPLDIGPPPQSAQVMTNRMSPPGIVMFYVSENKQTALSETVSEEGEYVVGKFRCNKDIILLDFCKLPLPPRYFNATMAGLRNKIHFLHSFVNEISRPIARDDRVNVEYIPTQVVTEYIQHKFRCDGQRIDGIKYPSSRHINSSCIVLFADSEDVIVKDKVTIRAKRTQPWLEMIEAVQESVRLMPEIIS